ncbi:MAG: signal transduction histidine kinase, partial [Nitrospirae bacterium]|nr:signal transduction histidine kinase [Nitrospirota bacterium]
TSELRPSVLDDFGMQAAIEWAAKEFEKRSGVTCRVLSRPASITMDRTRSTVIYRVLQESLTNVARHAKATNVVVSLDLEGERFRMTVQDDGKGIPARKAGDSSSYGLMGMRERVRFLGGDFSISGGKGRGTTLMVSIPLSGTRQSTGGTGSRKAGRRHAHDQGAYR